VIEKLDFLVRFWELKARHATLVLSGKEQPLDQREQTELLSLLQLVTSDLKLPEAAPAARASNALPAQLIGEGVLLAVEVRALTASALVVASSSRVPNDAQMIVRVTDAVSGVEYALPCKVLWVHQGSPFTAALVVDGIPTRTSFDAPSSRRLAGRPLRHTERLFGWSTQRAPVALRRQ
jgi:hypothetical protein